MDGALALAESGNFPEMPIFASAAGEDAQVNMPFTVVPAGGSRGRAPPRRALGKRKRERKEEVDANDIAGEEEQPATEAERAVQLFRMRRTRARSARTDAGAGSPGRRDGGTTRGRACGAVRARACSNGRGARVCARGRIASVWRVLRNTNWLRRLKTHQTSHRWDEEKKHADEMLGRGR